MEFLILEFDFRLRRAEARLTSPPRRRPSHGEVEGVADALEVGRARGQRVQRGRDPVARVMERAAAAEEVELIEQRGGVAGVGEKRVEVSGRAWWRWNRTTVVVDEVKKIFGT